MPLINVGSVAVDIVPSAGGFQQKLNAAVRDVTVQVRAELEDGGVRQRIDELARNATVSLRADVDDAAAKARLDALARGRSTTLNVDVDSGRAESQLAGLSAQGGAAEAALGAVIAAGVSLAPAIVPAAAAAAGAVAGIGSAGLAGVAGLGVLIIGLRGIVSAVGEVTKAQASSAAAAQQSAARQVAAANRIAGAQAALKSAQAALANAQASAGDAARRSAEAVTAAQAGVRDASQQASQGVTQALQQEIGAERTLQEALRQEKAAQDALSGARQQAKRDLQDLSFQVQDAALSQRQSVLDVQNAQTALAQAQKSGSAPQVAQAQLSYDQALQRQKELAVQQQRLIQRQKDLQAKGVEGSAGVVSAKQQVADSGQKVTDAKAGVDQAQQAVVQARLAGTERIRKAEKALADAETAQAAQQRQSAYAIAQAQQQVITSQRTLKTAYEGTGAAANTASDKARDALSRLTPQGRALVTLITSQIIPGFNRLSNLAQAPIAAGITTGLRAMQPLVPVVTSVVRLLGAELGRLAASVGRSLGSPFWVSFFRLLGSVAVPTIRTFIGILGGLGRGLAGVLTAFAPLGQQIGAVLLTLSRRFADFGTGRTRGLQDFVGYVQRVGPLVVSTLGSLASAAGRILQGLAPIGGVGLTIIKGLADGIRHIPIKVLTDVGVAIIGIVLATKILIPAIRGVGAAINTAMKSNPIGLVLLAVTALAAGIVILYNHSKAFRDLVNNGFLPVLRAIGQRIVAVVMPAFRAIGGFIEAHVIPLILRLGGQVLKGLREGFDVVTAAIRRNKPQLDQLHHAFSVVAAFITDKVLPLLGPILKYTFIGLGYAIGDFIDVVGAIVTAFRKVRDFVTGLLGPNGSLRTTFSRGVKALGDIWSGLKAVAAAPIKFVVNTVLNDGLIAAFDSIVDLLGVKKLHINPIKLPAGFARGGIIPGFTPLHEGDDVLTPTRRGEGVAVSEAMRDPSERNRLLALNSWTLSGKSPSGFARSWGYAGGGIVGSEPDRKVFLNGNAVSAIAAAQLALAEQIGHLTFRVIQGGYGGNHVAASGTSHNYPGVVDVGPASIANEKLLRQVGFAAWARNIAGRSQVGSGAHIHAASLLDPGNARDPQITGSWPNNGNGLSGYRNDPAPHYAWIADLKQRLGAVNLSTLAGGGSVDFIGQLSAKITSALASLKQIGSSPWAQMIAQAPRSIGSAMLSKARSFVTNLTDSIGLSNSSGQAVEKWRPTIALALKTLGLPVTTDYVNAWLRQIRTESGGNQNAIQQISDINSASGNRARGLLQVIPPTFSKFHLAGHDNIFNGYDNALAAMNYARSRYGVEGMLAQIGRGHGYDNGGYLMPGTHIIHNDTGQPEPVFTNGQLDLMKRLVARPQRVNSYEGANFYAMDSTELIRNMKAQDRLDAALHPVWPA